MFPSSNAQRIAFYPQSLEVIKVQRSVVTQHVFRADTIQRTPAPPIIRVGLTTDAVPAILCMWVKRAGSELCHWCSPRATDHPAEFVLSLYCTTTKS